MIFLFASERSLVRFLLYERNSINLFRCFNRIKFSIDVRRLLMHRSSDCLLVTSETIHLECFQVEPMTNRTAEFQKKNNHIKVSPFLKHCSEIQVNFSLSFDERFRPFAKNVYHFSAIFCYEMNALKSFSIHFCSIEYTK